MGESDSCPAVGVEKENTIMWENSLTQHNPFNPMNRTDRVT